MFELSELSLYVFFIFNVVTKIVSISLSIIILIQSFGIIITDIAQIDEFIEHAQFHSEQYADNIFVFISKHYGDLKVAHYKDHQEEKEDHEQLPFQQHLQLSSTTAFVITTYKEEIKTIEFSEFKSHHFHYQELSSSIHLDNPFQPPRQA